MERCKIIPCQARASIYVFHAKFAWCSQNRAFFILCSWRKLYSHTNYEISGEVLNFTAQNILIWITSQLCTIVGFVTNCTAFHLNLSVHQVYSFVYPMEIPCIVFALLLTVYNFRIRTLNIWQCLICAQSSSTIGITKIQGLPITFQEIAMNSVSSFYWSYGNVRKVTRWDCW